MLRRNRFGFRLRRRSFSNRLMQVLVVCSVLCLFIYFILYAFNLNSDFVGPDYSWLKTRNMSVYVRPSHDTTLLEPSSSSICKPDERLRLLVMVFSKPSNFEERRVIRRTWGRGLKKLPGVRVMFNLGTAETEKMQAHVETEHKENDDLIQHDFVDSYVNLTIKTTFMLKWATSNDCVKAKFIFKVDDDTFVNPTILWENLEHALLHTTTTKSLMSYIPTPTDEGATPIQPSESIDYLFMGSAMTAVPIRNPRNKWYLPVKFYPLNIFPRYLSGSGYVFSTSIAPMLYQCALRTPYMNLEDVFLTGLCGTTQLGLKLTHNLSFRYAKPLVGPNYVCYYKTSSFVHGLEAEEMAEMFARMADDHNCDTFYFAFVQMATSVVGFFKNLFRL